MKNLKVSMKLFVGFGVAVALILTVGIVSIAGLKNLNDNYSETIDKHGKPLGDAAHILEALHSLRADVRNAVILTGKEEELRMTEANIVKQQKEYNEAVASFSKFIVAPENKERLNEAKDAFDNGFMPAVNDILSRAKKGESSESLLTLLQATATPQAGIVSDKMDLVIESKQQNLDDAQADGAKTEKTLLAVMMLLIAVSIAVSIFFAIYIAGLIGGPVSRLSKLIGEWSSGHLESRLNIKGRLDEIGLMAEAADKWVDTLNDLIVDDGGKVLKAAAEKDMTQRLKKEYKGAYAVMKDNINTVVQNLDAALSQVREAVSQVTSASSEISNGAQSLAEGANQQASSLEEVSSSLEEMSSMTKQNADNSNQAKILATEARSAANSGDASMKKMAEAIQQIKQSSDNTAKIVKSIDDIAFQTNLLALNAAVEAARAGEAGKGFAVVAEEVRNLAMRSAEAAKNTANMIEESVKNADGGVKITEEVAKSLGQIVDRTQKVGDLIAEIAAASSEQSLGIEQVNTAVASMNQVTQNNAANSEESASAAEELSSQASELANMVSEFTLSGDNSRQPKKNVRRELPAPQKFAALPNKKAGSKTKVAGGWVGTNFMKNVKAEEIIPLNDEELSEF